VDDPVLVAYGKAVNAAVQSALGKAGSSLVGHFGDQMSQHDAWTDIGPFLDSWVEDGTLMVGVRSPDMVSEAWNAEFGQEGKPPTPIFRTAMGASRMASDVLTATLTDYF
jgi:hypothetical protein